MAGLVYISKGQLRLRSADGEEKTIESQFGRSLRDRAAQIENRHAWKSQGRGAHSSEVDHSFRRDGDHRRSVATQAFSLWEQ